MAAPKGNKNALKWTKEKSEQLFKDAIKLTDKKESYIINGKSVEGYKFDFIGEIARELGTYHKAITRDIINNHPELKTQLNILINNLEQNCYSNTKKGIINTAVGIVNLKSNHKWTDRVDNTTKGEEIKMPIINFTSS
jgi:hypothetical protein